MKNAFKVALLATGVFVASQAKAQTHHDDDNVGHKITRTATKVGHKTSELAAKGAADVADKRYDNKRGPGGQKIYINKHSGYYYINKKGHRVYVTKSQLRDK